MSEGSIDTAGVSVEDLTIHSSSGAVVLAPTSLRVAQGTVTALTGPSGAGKTTLMRAVLGQLPTGTVRSHGSVHVARQDVFALNLVALQAFRRRHLAFVSQDPGAALNPAMRVRTLLREHAQDRTDAALAAVLARVGLGADCLARRPGELSGGEQRRVALALALVRKVDVLVVDEPIAGLHGQLRNSIAEVLRSVATDDGVAVVVSGHDTKVLQLLADEMVAVGEPRLERIRSAARLPAPVVTGPAALQARAISAMAGQRRLLTSVDLTVGAGESVAVVGPSGAGKTTLARVLAGIHTAASGTLEVNGRALAVGRARRSRRERRRVQLVPQNPLSTLNPKHTVFQTLSRPLRLNAMIAKAAVADRAASLLADVELDLDLLHRYPDELSGGQRQRVAIARALAVEPDVLICDEITSALDTGTAAAIMELVERTRVDKGIGVLVISHDMSVVAEYCRQILVLADGAVVEHGATTEVLADPSSPHTKALLV